MWFSYLPIILLAIILLTGLVLLVLGLRGRKVNTDPLCRKCRYNLTGLTSERCPECGSVVAEVGFITRRRERKWRMILIGLALLLPWTGLIPVRDRIGEYFDGYRYKPTSWVIADVESRNDRLCIRACEELEQRLDRKSLKAHHISHIVDRAVSGALWTSSTPSARPWAKNGLVGHLISEGYLTAEQFSRLCDTLLHISMTARRTSLLEHGIPVSFSITLSEMAGLLYISETPLVTLISQDEPLQIPMPQYPPTVPDLYEGFVIPIENLIDCPHYARIRPAAWSDESEAVSGRILVKKAGHYTLAFLVTVDFQLGMGYSPPRGPACRISWRFTLTSDVFNDPPADGVRIVSDVSVEPQLRRQLRVDLVRLSPNSVRTSRDHTHAVRIFVTDPPLALAFDWRLEMIGQTVCTGQMFTEGGHREVQFGDSFKMTAPDTCTATLVLTPNPRLAFQDLRVYEIWGKELRFEGMTVSAEPAE